MQVGFSPPAFFWINGVSMSKALMARADFFTSIIFLVLGVYLTYEGLGMPGSGPIIEPGGEPGRVPVMLGVIISLCAAVLLVRSLGQGGLRSPVIESSESAGDDGRRQGRIRCVLTAVGCSLYAVGLVGSSWFGWRMPYHLATGLFIFIFIVGFEWDMAHELGNKRWTWLTNKRPGTAKIVATVFGFLGTTKAPYCWLFVSALIQAFLVTWAVTYLFEREFYVTLP